MITSLTAHFTRIAVGDCRDGVLFFLYHEVSGQFVLLIILCFSWMRYLIFFFLCFFLQFHLLFLEGTVQFPP